MEIVAFILRDINGKRRRLELYWDDVCSYIDKWRTMLEEDEILMITVNDMCIYSGLTSTSITWEDAVGFFA